MSGAGGGMRGFGFDASLAAIGAESRRLSDAVAMSDLDAIVPSTPEWTVRDLAHHIGRGQWFWGENVMARDADAMALCKSEHCYDVSNHSTTRASILRRKYILGSKDETFVLSSAGQEAAAALVKTMAGDE